MTDAKETKAPIYHITTVENKTGQIVEIVVNGFHIRLNQSYALGAQTTFRCQSLDRDDLGRLYACGYWYCVDGDWDFGGYVPEDLYDARHHPVLPFPE
jgi:hypothetical protein